VRFSALARHPRLSLTLGPTRTDVVWSRNKMERLIDSLMHNFYIPPIIFGALVVVDEVPVLTRARAAVKRDNDGGEIKVCIDGKQRLTSLQQSVPRPVPCTPHADAALRPGSWTIRSHVGLLPWFSRGASLIECICRQGFVRLVPPGVSPATHAPITSVSGERLTYSKAAMKGKPMHTNDVKKLCNTQIVCVEYDDIS
jgi:hypothetical protein